MVIKAFSSEVGTGSREENASKDKVRSPALIQSEPGFGGATYRISAPEPIRFAARRDVFHVLYRMPKLSPFRGIAPSRKRRKAIN
jgi:hypothetical protein